MSKIIPKLTAITPTEIYLQRVNSTFSRIRVEDKGMSYSPCQFGGLSGQQKLNEKSMVLEIIDFEVK